MTLTDILEKAGTGAYGEDSDLIGKVFGILANAKFDHGTGPFICGAMGKMGSDGLHEGYIICPMYGADANVSAIFMRSNRP